MPSQSLLRRCYCVSKMLPRFGTGLLAENRLPAQMLTFAVVTRDTQNNKKTWKLQVCVSLKCFNLSKKCSISKSTLKHTDKGKNQRNWREMTERVWVFGVFEFSQRLNWTKIYENSQALEFLLALALLSDWIHLKKDHVLHSTFQIKLIDNNTTIIPNLVLGIPKIVLLLSDYHLSY